MHILVIANPISGGGRAGARARRLVERLESRGHRVELYATSEPGDAARRAASLGPELERLVVVGGDGTLNEVLNGLEDPTRVPLALLPSGTANLIGRELGLPHDPPRTAELVERGALRRIDLGRAGDRRFLAVASAGFDALVTREVQRRREGPHGYLSYVLPLLRCLPDYRPPSLEVLLDGRTALAGQFVLVGNTRHYGGLFTFADRARSDSGHLDVCLLERAGPWQIAGAVLAGLTGGLSGRAGVVYRTASRIEIRSAEPVPLQVDGDVAGTTPVTIEIRPRELPFLVPQAGDAASRGEARWRRRGRA